MKLCPYRSTRSSQVSTRQCSALFMTEECQVMLVQALWVLAYYRPLKQVSKMTAPSNQDMGKSHPPFMVRVTVGTRGQGNTM